jgi:hypothetical protein
MRNRELLEELIRKMDRVEVALIVRDPGTSLSADAYDGLRKQVAVAARERQAHLVQLAILDEALRSTDDVSAARSVLSELMQQAGLARIEDADRPDMYEVVAGKGTRLEILSPAYVEEATGRLIRQGSARATEPEGAAATVEPRDREPGHEMESTTPAAVSSDDEQDERKEPSQ